MAVSKRLRFEILRRDGFKCHYCGATAADTELHVDHIIPQALGGTDIPENLATSCADCNSGKGSTRVDEHVVAAIDEATAIAAAARARAVADTNALVDQQNAYEDSVLEIWHSYVPQYRASYAPAPSLQMISGWFDAGVSLDLVEFGIRIAISAEHVAWRGKTQYAAGVIRTKIREAGTDAP